MDDAEKAEIRADRRAGLTFREIAQRRKINIRTAHVVAGKEEFPALTLRASGSGVLVECAEPVNLRLAIYRALRARGFEVEVVDAGQ